MYVLFPLSAHSRPPIPIKVTGRILSVVAESNRKEVLPYANVMLLVANDSLYIKGGTTDIDGCFCIQFTPHPKVSYLLKASYTGLRPEYRKLTFDRKDLHLGDIILIEGLELSEVVVTAPIKEIEQVGDTTVINTAAYRPPEGSNLEELVKRIPGLDYNRQDGSLTYNGKSIAEINVNGEAFFSGDKKMALENLPVELVNKIKVYDKKSELEKITGVNSGTENYVLDLQIPKKFDGTLMASGKTGYGKHRKKELELIGNYFKQGGENVSVIGKSGNRTMTTDYRDNQQSNVATNFVKKFGQKLAVNGNVMYNRYMSGNESTSYSEQYLTTGNQYTGSAGSNISGNRMVSTLLGIRWQIDGKTFLNMSGNFGRNCGDNTNTSRQMTFDTNPSINASSPFEGIDKISDDIKLNGNEIHSLSSNGTNQYSVNAELTRRINEKGSSLSFTLQTRGIKGENKNFTRSTTTYYHLENQTGGDSILYRNQYSISPTKNRRQSAGILFTHPLSKKLRVQVSYNLNYQSQRNDRNTYDLSVFSRDADCSIGYLPPNYVVGYTDSLSNRSRSRMLGHEFGLRFNYSDKVWNVTAGMFVKLQSRSIDQKTGLLQADTTMYLTDLHPSITASWHKGKAMVRISYQGNTRQPPLSSLLSLTDNCDPLNITSGNPKLNPAYIQTVKVNAQHTKYGLFANVGWQNEFNSLTSALTYNPVTGGRTTRPMNINGNWGASADVRWQKRIKHYSVSIRGGSQLSRKVSPLNDGTSEEPQKSATRNTDFNGGLRLAYLPQWGAFDVSGRWRYQHSCNSLHQSDTYTHNYDLSLNTYVNLPGGFMFNTDATYTFRNGTNFNKGEDDQVVWNAGITWKFLKKKQAELSFYWADILSQKKNFTRSASSFGLSERHTQQIGSWFMFSFKYRFNKQL